MEKCRKRKKKQSSTESDRQSDGEADRQTDSKNKILKENQLHS